MKDDTNVASQFPSHFFFLFFCYDLGEKMDIYSQETKMLYFIHEA